MSDSLKNKGLDLLAGRVVELVDFIARTAPDFLVSQYKNGSLVLNKGLPEYLESNYTKCETIRTLLKRDSPTVLEKVYQPHRFQVNGTELPEKTMHSSIGVQLQRTIISGTAGSGKSVFLKRLFRESIESGVTYYPVFFEFRSMDPDGAVGIVDSLFDSIRAYSDGFTRKQFMFGLKRGLFYFMIDALDEAPSSMRERIASELNEFARKYPKCPIVITSRPSQDFISWEGFQVAHLMPFSKDQCRSFIGKVDFPDDKKTEFLDFLTDDSFKKHREFLSNPLLASMMLLTFDEYGDIPERKHVFYEKCFQVLLREHDSSKGRYRRQFKCMLSYEALEEVFTYFCVFSYLDRRFTFNRQDAINYISSALETTALKGNTEDIFVDFVESISILQNDAGHYEFSHRSFQEYFYAKFAVKDRDLPLSDKINEIYETSHSDGAIRMIADMDRTYFERDFLLPTALRIQNDVEGIDLSKCPDRIIGKFFAHVFARLREREDSEDASEKNTHNKLTISYSVTIDKHEYPTRKLNLLLLNFISEYDLSLEWNPPESNLSDDDILRVFNAKELPRERRKLSFKINHQNRKKLVSLNSSYFAENIHSRVKALTNRLSTDISARKSKLSERILTGKKATSNK